MDDDTDVPDVRLKITTYQKPHHQYMYIPYHRQLSQASCHDQRYLPVASYVSS
jgi:hypothetical protein